MNLEATLLSRITELETLLLRQLASTPVLSIVTAAQLAVTDERVKRILAQQQFRDKRTLVIILTPNPRSELRSIFSNQPNSIRRAVEHPPEIRQHGWNFGVGAPAHSIDGDFIQTEGFRDVVNLYRDGELIVATRIDSESLAWANETRIHPLAFVEFVANTLTFYRLVLADMHIAPQTLRIELRLHGLIHNDVGISLPVGTINNVGWVFGGRRAPAATCSRAIPVDASTYNPARTSFLILREVYFWFGHAEEDIPYTTGTGDDRVIDTAAIASIG
jgi:hypothetical protein